MSFKLRNLIFKEESSDKDTTPVAPKEKPTTLETGINTPAYNTNNHAHPATGQTPVQYYSAPPALPAEELEKWQNYIIALKKASIDQNPVYKQFLENMEIVSDPSEPSQTISSKVRLAFNIMRKQNGITKDSLVQSIQSAINGITNDRISVFEVKQSNRTKEGIDDNVAAINKKQDDILRKQEEIKKLMGEISVLEQNINDTKQHLGVRESCYNLLSNQLLEETRNILASTNYIV